MALFSDAVRALADSKHFWVKVFITAGVFAFGASKIFPGELDLSPINVILFALCAIFTAGYTACYTNNMLNERANILPGFLNPFKFLLTGLGLVTVCIPCIIAGVLIWKFTVPFIMSFDKPLYSGIIVACLFETFPLGIMAYQTCAYSENFNIFRAFNVTKCSAKTRLYFLWDYRLSFLRLYLYVWAIMPSFTPKASIKAGYFICLSKDMKLFDCKSPSTFVRNTRAFSSPVSSSGSCASSEA